MKNKRIIGELKRIAKNSGGMLRPETVVNAAEPKNSPLHSRFEWNNKVAGHQYRIWQARQLIRVSVEVWADNSDPVDVFVSLTTDRKPMDAEGKPMPDSSGYRIVTEVLSDAELRRQMLADALAELELFREKYARLKELAAVFSAIRKVKR
jgi:hypothetical protein